MRATILIALSAALVGVQAQINKIPPCALNCLLTGIISTGCGTTDFKCSCSNQAFIVSASTCIQGACSPAEVLTAKDATRVLCSDNGVEIVFPDDPPATSAPPPATSAPPPATSAPPPATSAPPPATSAPPPASSAPPPASSAPPPATQCPAAPTVTVTAPGGTVTVTGPGRTVTATVTGPGATVTVPGQGTTVTVTKTASPAPTCTSGSGGGKKKCIGPCLALECCFNWKKGRLERV